MKTGIFRHFVLKKGFVLLAVILLAATLLLVGVQAAFAFSPEYVTWPEYPSNPVFDPTERAYYPSIIFDGSTYHMWYDDGSGIRYTTSADGITWATGTVVTGLTSGRHPVVVNTGSQYRMWYWNSSVTYGIGSLRTAVSTNAITWTSDAVITQAGTTVITGTWPDWNNGSYGPCEVFYNASGSATIVSPVDATTVWQNKYVMYYDGTTGGLEDIGIAVSNDGINFEGFNGGAAPVLSHGGGSTWDSNYAAMCTVQKIDGAYHMWYSGGQSESNEGIGYAQSFDGITWTKYGSNPIMHKTDGVPWRASRTYTPRVLYDSNSFSGAGEAKQLKMWWNGTAGSNYAIGYSGIITATPTTTTTPAAVGGQVNPLDKTAVLMPYIYGILAIIAVTVGGLIWRRVAITRENSRNN
jgi:predicted GH43/DUF377 family glycosyl hydrolase